MWFSSWTRSRRSLTSRERRGAHRSARRRATFRPALAALEDRRLLSTLTVTSSLDNGGTAGDGTLRGEIAAAYPGDTIVFAPSLNGQTITLDSPLGFGGLTIQGPGAGLLAISGSGRCRVFEVDGPVGSNSTISGLKIEGGNAATDVNSRYLGGGILNSGTLTLSGCTVTNNNTFGSGAQQGQGGGIYNEGNMTLSGCTVTANSAGLGGFGFSQGGGIYNDGTMTLSGSTVTGNTASLGGGILNDQFGSLTILSSVVKKNDPINGYDIVNNGWISISKDSTIGKINK